jgi:hypothetical protein
MIAPHPKEGLRVAAGRNIVGSRVGLVRFSSKWPSKAGHKGTSKQRTPEQTWTAQRSPNRNGFRSVVLRNVVYQGVGIGVVYRPMLDEKRNQCVALCRCELIPTWVLLLNRLAVLRPELLTALASAPCDIRA